MSGSGSDLFFTYWLTYMLCKSHILVAGVVKVVLVFLLTYCKQQIVLIFFLLNLLHLFSSATLTEGIG